MSAPTRTRFPAVVLANDALGVGFERLVNRFEALRHLRVNLLAVGRKR